MPPKLVYFIIEGPDDTRFFDNIIKPMFEDNGCSTKCVPCAGMVRKERSKIIRSIKKMSDQNYIYAKDIDRYPCVSSQERKYKK